MKELYLKLIEMKSKLCLSTLLAGITGFVSSLFQELSVRDLFGISLTLWLIAMFVNLIDIKTGLRAFTFKRKLDGQEFVFNSKKGWRAIEKAVAFTGIIMIIYLFEKECIKLGFSVDLVYAALTLKYFVFFYGILMEVVSIGENKEVYLGQKPKFYVTIDRVSAIVTDGLYNRIKNLLGLKSDTNENAD